MPRLAHDRVWQAIDTLAVSRGLSASGLALRAGLDATALNRSKRNGRDGRPRWPSLDSLARILDAAECDIDEFFGLASVSVPQEDAAGPGWVVGGDPGLAALPGFLDTARPIQTFGQAGLVQPDTPREPLVAIEVIGTDLLPLYGPGDTLILSPGANIARGDRIVAYVTGLGLLARRIARASRGTLSFAATAHGPETTISRKTVVWQARVVWVSQ